MEFMQLNGVHVPDKQLGLGSAEMTMEFSTCWIILVEQNNNFGGYFCEHMLLMTSQLYYEASPLKGEDARQRPYEQYIRGNIGIVQIQFRLRL